MGQVRLLCSWKILHLEGGSYCDTVADGAGDWTILGVDIVGARRRIALVGR
jgi:hypothetical protein